MTQDTYDLLIRDALIVDGTGEEPYRGDVAVSGERIAAVGKAPGAAGRVIDGAGLAVCPGFVDVHSHDDAAIVHDPRVDFKVMQGVTTDVIGNCGAGVAPTDEGFQRFYERGLGGGLGPLEIKWRTTAEYLRAVDEAAPSLNVVPLCPHGVLRYLAMGLERRPPTDGELATMKSLLADAMEAGVAGFSTGLIYPPSMFAETEELVELAKVAAEYGGLYVTHMRNEGTRVVEAVEEALRIGREGGVGVQISHHKASGREAWGKTKESLARIDRARVEGEDVWIDVYPYVAASTALNPLVAPGFERVLPPEDVLIASTKHDHSWEGMRLSQVAEKMDLPVEDAARRLLREEDNAVVVVMFTMEEGDVRRVLKHESAMLGSDGLPSAGGKPHPRLYSTFSRVLDLYVRREGVLSLAEAVRKMSAAPAKRFRLRDRGEIREGHFADLVVFEPEGVRDIATYEEPRRYPEGIRHVLVNGKLVVEDGRHTGAHAGRVLRREG